MRVAWLVMAAIALGCTGDGSDDGAISAASLPAMVLQPDDLPADHSVFDEGRQAIADAPGGERADPARFGRRDGWKARYRRSDPAATDGPLVIESRVDLFDDSDGAHREFEAHRDELATGDLAGNELVDVDDLGDEAVAVGQRSDDAADTLATHMVVWRERNVTASIVANGFSGRFSVEDVIELARAQHRRIEAAPPG